VALIAIAADKGAPGVTTTAMALTAVWPRPILLAECDPSGGDLVYRFRGADGGHLDPRRGLLTLAIAARRGMPPQQAWEHVQKMQGGIDLLAGVTNAEQGAGLNSLWGSVGRLLASLPQADVIADCGRLGVHGPVNDLLAEASLVVLVAKSGVGDVIRLRDRAAALAGGADGRRRGTPVGVIVIADQRRLGSALGEVQHVLNQGNVPAAVIGGMPDDPRGAELFRDGQVGKLNKTLLVKAARGLAKQIVGGLPGQPQFQPQQGLPPYAPPQPSQQIQPQQIQPQRGQAQPGTTSGQASDPPGVLVASRRGRHNKGQNTVPHAIQPDQQPPAELFPSQSSPPPLPPLPDPGQNQQAQNQQAQNQQAQNQQEQTVLRVVPIREQSGG
jgi:hypothetical protein